MNLAILRPTIVEIEGVGFQIYRGDDLFPGHDRFPMTPIFDNIQTALVTLELLQ